jgi:hypothetical protein
MLEEAHISGHERVIQGEISLQREHRSVRRRLAHKVDRLAKARSQLLFVPFYAQQLCQHVSRHGRRFDREIG